ncbi:MAG: YihY/virulence factor BrkB family protein [Anaerolineales bacterium]|nr:YihY/virulence factor BrkB family protein [Anaerolineales bacterium]
MKITDRVKELYQSLNQRVDGRVEILKTAIQRFGEQRAAQASASLSYYALFSLFPLLLALISLGGYFLESEQVRQQVLDLLYQGIPVSQDLITQNLDRVIDARGSVGFIGLIGLIWSASGVFTGLAYNINLAWPETEPRNFFEKRLVAFTMIAVLILLLVLSIILQTTMTILPNLEIPVISKIEFLKTGLWSLLTNLIPWLLIFSMYLAIYRWVPTRRVDWVAVFWSALVTATAWKLITNLFTWYLESGLGRYELVYGSLGTVVALMFLIYLMSWITLFGAHLCAAIEKWQQEQHSAG